MLGIGNTDEPIPKEISIGKSLIYFKSKVFWKFLNLVFENEV